MSSGKYCTTETGLVLIYLKNIIANLFRNSTRADVCSFLEMLIWGLHVARTLRHI